MMLFLSCFSLILICQRTLVLARPNGFEPLTLGFGIRCSTSWSYRRVLQDTLNLLELISLCSLVFPPTFFCSQDRNRTYCSACCYRFFTSATNCDYLTILLLILIPFYFEANLLIFKYEFLKGTGCCSPTGNRTPLSRMKT